MGESYRPHHIFCQRFLNLSFPERGEEFAAAKRRAIEVIGSHDETLVEAVEGVDRICRVCQNRQGDRCESPAGNEEAVRKWDAIILKGLGIGYGETRTAKQWRALIDGKAPLDLCTSRCPYRSKCTIAGSRTTA
jgi:hypothetical protein